MSDPEISSDLESFQTLILFVMFLLPGFVSMRVFTLINPTGRLTLKDNVLEAIAFSLTNFAIGVYPLLALLRPGFVFDHPWETWGIIVLLIIIIPLLTPVVLTAILLFLDRTGWILSMQPTAWDHYFRQRKPSWVIVHLLDGRRIGGKFGRNSYASSYPDHGHIYLEELYVLDANGAFLHPVPRSGGIILGPGSYRFVELFRGD